MASQARQLAQGVTQPTGRKNLIINGAMQVAQRGTETTGVTTVGYYACDRWDTGLETNGTYTISQESDAPSGFSNSLKYLCTVANTDLTGTKYVTLRQRIEAQNLQHLNFGTADAKSLTASFWVKSNKTGTYTLAVEPDDAALNNGKTFVINTADTWEYKTITFSGQKSGTAIANDNGVGIELQWWLGAGTSFTSGTFTEDVYTSTTANRVSSSNVNLSDSVNNYFQITGVQLEVGSTATEFEHHSYAEELALCQRYFVKLNTYSIGYTASGNISYSGKVGFPQTMRASPSLTNGTYTPQSGNAGTVGTVTVSNQMTHFYNVSNNWSTGVHMGLTVDIYAEL